MDLEKLRLQAKYWNTNGLKIVLWIDYMFMIIKSNTKILSYYFDLWMDKLKKVTTAIMNWQCLFMKIFTINNCPKGSSTTFSVLNKPLFQPNSYFVCILECSDNSYYTGVTNNLERRIVLCFIEINFTVFLLQ